MRKIQWTCGGMKHTFTPHNKLTNKQIILFDNAHKEAALRGKVSPKTWRAIAETFDNASKPKRERRFTRKAT